MGRIVLSKRMQGLVNMLKDETNTGDTLPCVVDIGCDHAFVSMYLVENEIANRVIAMDVRKGPLEIATNNIHKYGFEKRVETRLSNGFGALETNEATWAVIAGMGGLLINSILEEGKIHLKNKIGLVLQPQSEIDEVRKYLLSHHYRITDEEFLQEDGKFYTIIKAIWSEEETEKFADYEFLYGCKLLKKKNLVLKEYLLIQEKKYLDLMEKLGSIDTEHSKVRAGELQRELDVINRALSIYKEA